MGRIGIFNNHPVTDIIVTQPVKQTIYSHLIGGLPSQMKLSSWQLELEQENNQWKKDFILDGIQYGFAIVDSDCDIPTYHLSNYNSAIKGDAKQYLNELFTQELEECKYKIIQEVPWCVHSIGAVPKGESSFRPITDCRRPLGLSINNYMRSTFDEFRYESLDNVCHVLKPDMFMCTVDISAAYRSISVRQDQWQYQGVSWNFGDGKGSQYMVDTRLCFGLRCAPYIFSIISGSIVDMMSRKGFDNIFVYLDDFLILGQSFDECQAAQMTLIHLLISLGFYINWAKCTTPANRCKYLGVLVDTNTMTLSLPRDKLQKFHREIAFFKDKNRATKRQLQRLCGILNHCGKLIRGGRTFTRRVVDMLKGLPDRNVRLRLSKGFELDLEWWENVASYFNGVTAIINPKVDQFVYSDASRSGYGVVMQHDWIAGFFNTEVLPADIMKCEPSHNHWVNMCVPKGYCTNINVLESLPLLLMCRKFGHLWKNQRVLSFSDNLQVVSLVNTGNVVNEYCMSIMRFIFWESVRNNFQLVAEYVPGENNVVADYLSRIAVQGKIFKTNFELCCSGSGNFGSRNRTDNIRGLGGKY